MHRSSRKERILCVDDHAATREVLTVIFERAGYEITCCASITEGLDLVASLNFDLYLFDICLPDGSGIDLARRVRDHDELTPIVFLSASAYPEDINAGMEAGAQAYIVKPMSMDDLLETVRSLIKGSGKDTLGIELEPNRLAI